MQPKPAMEVDPEVNELRRKVLTAFEGRIAPVKVPLLYRLGLLVVAIIMVVLPLVYVGLISLFAYALYYHAVYDITIFKGTSAKAALVGYLAPLVAGGILLLFMIKPLFARAKKTEKPRAISRKDEPLLFAFVERVCLAVGAPMPTEIRLACDINASASFREGFFSLFGNDLVLTIGMPLAAGLSLRQFAGVLAHEFGHFAQHAGMRMTYVIRAVNFWFVRVVYERDDWDEWLTAASKENDIRIGIVFYIARFFVWITRKVLFVLMIIGHTASCFMLRQMEFDADRYEAWLAGSNEFATTMKRLPVLNVASQLAHSDLKESFNEGRLADNLPALIVASERKLTPEIHKKIDENSRAAKTKLFDTHPADPDRIANVQSQAQPGQFIVDLPATALFSDFTRTSRDATADYYKDILGPAIHKVKLFPVEEMLSTRSQEEESQKALARFFQEPVSILRPVPLPSIVLAAPNPAEESVSAIASMRENMATLLPAYKSASAGYKETVKRLQAANVLLLPAKVNLEEMDLPKMKKEAAGDVRRKAEQDREKLGAELTPYEQAAGERLSAALNLLKIPEIAAKIPDAEKRCAEAARLLPVTVLVGRMLPDLVELQNALMALGVLISDFKGHEEDEAYIGTVKTRASSLRARLKPIYDKLGSVEYPFDHAQGKITLQKFTIAGVPSAMDISELGNASEQMLDKMLTLYFRMLAHLAESAEKAELAAGLPALPDVAEKTSDAKTKENAEAAA
jgi:Zn-dependent protease with chaperone function